MTTRLDSIAGPARWLIAVTGALALLFFSVSLAGASDRTRDLEAIRRQVARLELELERVDRESAGLERELRRTGLEIRLQEERLEVVRLERAAAEEGLLRRREGVRAMQAKVERTRAALRARLASLYRRDERHLARALLNGEGRGDVMGDLRLLRLAAYGDALGLRAYRTARLELAQELERMLERQRLLDVLATRERGRLLELERMKSAQRRALEILDRRRAGMAATAAQLLAKEEKVELLIEILSGRETPKSTELAINDFRGALDWPLRGPILKGFGSRLDRRYRTRIPHNGIEIQAASGSKVSVVFPGVVMFAAPFEDFGLTVVVHHPESVFSLYAGLSTSNVSKGDVVSFDQRLGSAGDRLYFEIRRENRPQDPISWLR